MIDELAGQPSLEADQAVTQADKLIAAAKLAMSSNPQRAADLAAEALELATGSSYEGGIAHSLFYLGSARLVLGDLLAAEQRSKAAAQLYRKLQDKAGLAWALRQLGRIAIDRADYPKARSIIRTCQVIFEDLDDPEGTSACANSLGVIEYKCANYSRALGYYFQTLKILEEGGFHGRTAVPLNNIGTIYSTQKNYEAAIQYLTRSMAVSEENNDIHNVALCHYNLATCNYHLAKYEPARLHYTKALQLFQQLHEPKQIATTLTGLSDLDNKLGQLDEAKAAALEALTLREELGDRWGIAETNRALGSLYLKAGQLDAARRAYQAACALTREIGGNQLMFDALQGLVDVALAAGDDRSAVEYYQELIKCKDEIYSEEKHRQIAELNILYETEKKDQQLRQMQKLEAIGTLAGGIAHDFNNILSVIQADAQMAGEKLSAAGQEMEELDEILTACRRATDLVQQILTFARRRDAKLAPVDFGLLVKEVHKLIRTTLPATINITLNLPGTPLIVVADPSHLHQVLMNLCTNARQAMFETGGTLSLKAGEVELDPPAAGLLGLPAGGRFVLLEVTDTGTGIPPEIIERIFDPFFTTKAEGEGTGLGLSVVHGIVTELGGALKVDSEPGAGTTFNVYLPLSPAPPEAPAADAAPLPRGRERVLVVDADPATAALQARMLSHLGYQAESFVNGHAALAAFQAAPGKYDLLVTALGLPEVTGDTLAWTMLQLKPELPVILCLGYGETVSDEAARTCGACAVLSKPVSRLDLAHAVRRVLDAGS